MKKITSIIWGLILAAAGVILALNILGVIRVSVFFDGWWTLFIIIPCLIGLITTRAKAANLIGLICGVVLLLCCQDVLSFSMLWKLLIPAVIIVIGLKMVFNGIFQNQSQDILSQMKKAGAAPESGCAAFSGCNMNFDGQPFRGADLTAAFGSLKCDLRHAVIEQDCAIQATAVFGGITVYAPENLSVKVVSNSLFGGVSHKKAPAAGQDGPTLYLNCICMFGGVDIK